MERHAALITSKMKKGRDAVRTFEAGYNEAGLNAERAQRLNERGGELKAGVIRLINELAPIPEVQRIVRLDNLEPFDPATFPGLGSGWRRNPDGSDPRSKAIVELDERKLKLVSPLRDEETWIVSEEQVRRIRAGTTVPLDLRWLRYYWTHQERIPESWKERVNGNMQYVFFDGDELLDPCGRRYSLCLCWDDGAWLWSCLWHDSRRSRGNPSVVLAQ